MKHKMRSTGEGSARVWLIDEQTIGCSLHGSITETVVHGSMRETRRLVEQQASKGRQTRLLLDIREVASQTSGARSAAKELGDFKFRKIAVFGGGRVLSMIGEYIARAGGMGNYTKFFRTEAAALDWLNNKPKLIPERGSRSRFITGSLTIFLAIGALAGWAVGEPGVDSLTTSFKPMNPVSCLSFVLLGGVLLMFDKEMLSRWRKVAIGAVAIFVLVVGLSVVIEKLAHINVALDALLYADRLDDGAFTGHMSMLSAGSFVLVAGMIFLVLGGQRRIWQRYAFHGLSLGVFAAAFGSLVHYAFSDASTGEGLLMPMSLGSSFCFLLFSRGMHSVNVPIRIVERSKRLFDTYWPALSVFCVMLVLTGVAWRQSSDAIEQRVDSQILAQLDRSHDALSGRAAAYVDALRSYKAFFESSDAVTASEFHTYFTNSELHNHYPGFKAISFIANVPAKDKQAFTARVRKEEGSANPAYKNFTIYPATAASILFPSLYIEPDSSGSGFDLGTDTERRATLTKAMQSGEPVASGAINLNLAQGSTAPAVDGFFITMPVYRAGQNDDPPRTIAERVARSQGFINAVFENKQLFADIFGSAAIDNGIRVVVTNTATNKQLFTYRPEVAEVDTKPRTTRDILVAGQRWQIALYAAPEFGKSAVEEILSRTVLNSGILLTIVATWLVANLSRRRAQALSLADSMTEDLNNERDAAVALQRKDEAILRSIGDGVFVIDVEQRITMFNPVAERISGYRADEVLGKPYKDFLKFQFETNGKENDTFVRQALGGHPGSMKNHTMLIRRDGARVPVGDSAAPIHDRNGKLTGVIVVFRDVSKEYALDQAKTEFVSLASHQLRTPLTAISWNTELLLGGDAGKIGKMQKDRLVEIQNGTKRMIELVDSLLNVSRLDLDRLGNEPQANNLIELIDSLEQELVSSIRAKSLVIVKNVDKRAPAIHADPKLVRMIVQNLLSNAVKYTPAKGTITVTLRAATEQDRRDGRVRQDGPAVFFSVTDTGYGIPKAQQSKIFSKLFRADNVRVLDVEGTGLGLYIVQQVVNRFGGRVWFESMESVGTTFFVVVPSKTKVWKKKEPGVTVSTHDTIAIADKIGG